MRLTYLKINYENKRNSQIKPRTIRRPLVYHHHRYVYHLLKITSRNDSLNQLSNYKLLKLYASIETFRYSQPRSLGHLRVCNAICGGPALHTAGHWSSMSNQTPRLRNTF